MLSLPSLRRRLTQHILKPTTPYLRPSPHPFAYSRCSSSTPDSPIEDPSPTTSLSDTIIYPSSSTTKHHNLSTFLAYAERTGLNPASTTYVGTHFEYTVQSALSRYGFSLRRIGGAGDNGIDLLGTWTLPLPTTSPSSPSSSTSPSTNTPQPLRAMLQCKGLARKSTTQHIRELEGALLGAPRAWSGRTIAFLASAEPATSAMRNRMRDSATPMGFVCCSKEGAVTQMLWNQAAVGRALGGVSVALRYVVGKGGEREGRVRLLWRGEVIPLVDAEAGVGMQGEVEGSGEKEVDVKEA